MRTNSAASSGLIKIALPLKSYHKVSVQLSGSVLLGLVENLLGGLNVSLKLVVLDSSRSYVIKGASGTYHASPVIQSLVTQKTMTAMES